MNTFSTFDIAGSALAAQSLRLNLTASNLANMHDVTGDPAGVYRARHAVFRASGQSFNQALAGVARRRLVLRHVPEECADGCFIVECLRS